MPGYIRVYRTQPAAAVEEAIHRGNGPHALILRRYADHVGCSHAPADEAQPLGLHLGLQTQPGDGMTNVNHLLIKNDPPTWALTARTASIVEAQTDIASLRELPCE